ncbi:MAG: aminoacyl-tRNA hydrolase [Phycisphaeraceae bacterium]|nr:aminoacyl-tRNA hydrolase [Phycisphaeraceae bacterium]
MKLIVGLGNPGRQYDKTRHNAGYMVVDRLVEKFAPGTPVKAKFNAAIADAKIGSEAVMLMKPTTYMNRSGAAIAEAVRFYKLVPASDLLVFVDDVALPIGALRIRPGGGAGGHNGLTDIEQALGTDAYPRCRIGIGATPSFMDQADWVLGRFTDEEWDVMGPAIGRAAEAAEVFVTSGLDSAMNRFNAPDRPPKPKRERPPPKAGPEPPAKPPDQVS